MLFIVSESAPNIKNTDNAIVWLKPSNWDDYSYKTVFGVFIRLDGHLNGEWLSFGEIRIIRLNQERSSWTRYKLQEEGLLAFESLPSHYCSLAVGKDYYNKLEVMERAVGRVAIKKVLLTSLNDITESPIKAVPFENRETNEGFYLSLLRDSEGAYLFRKLKNDAAHAKFFASIQIEGAQGKHEIYVDFTRHSNLPHRTFVIIGENGVGKTQLLSRLAINISGFESVGSDYLREDVVEPRGLFNNVLALSFSAFDDFEIPNARRDAQRTSYRYCGLRGSQGNVLETSALLRKTISTIVEMDDEREYIFQEYAKEMFPDLDFSSLVPHQEYKDRHIALSTEALLKKTSAGQRITVAILANLVAHLQENSLVVFDEPETHLHPSLLSKIMSFMGQLLIKYKSYALISTHSPLILQQTPARYIKIIKRMENVPRIVDVPIETFGENLTEISQSVFDVHDNDRDYKKIFENLLEKTDNDPDNVAKMFDERLGISAKSLLYSLAKIRKNS